MAMDRLRSAAKNAIARSGGPAAHALDDTSGLPRLGPWFREHAARVPEFGRNRGLYAHLNEKILETWRGSVGTTARGALGLGGRVPEIADERVHFVVGAFQETLAGFLTNEYQPGGGRRVVHCDADLYTSTLFVLATMDSWLVPGSVMVFDELDSPVHEVRAFVDYLSAFRRRFRALARTGPLLARHAVELVE